MKLFTKSAFKIALGCPTRLYYYYDSDKYANQDTENEFLKSLAEGGFQVGELAKIYHGVAPDCDLKDLTGYDAPVVRTKELLSRETVAIAEAAFRCDNMFVKVDILKKDGDKIDLIEVKSKSWNPETDAFLTTEARGANRGMEKVASGIAEYVYDVSFQKYVVEKALREEGFNGEVRAYLMMADKSVASDVDGINQLFKICHADGRIKVEVSSEAYDLVNHVHVLNDFDVTDVCDKVIAGSTAEQANMMHGMQFKPFVEKMSGLYCDHRQEYVPVSTECYKCPFYATSDTPGKLDGYDECWINSGELTADDIRSEHLLEELWNNKNTPFANGVRLLKDVSRTNLRSDPLREPSHEKPGLNTEDRRIVQVALTTNQTEMLEQGDLLRNVRDGVYFDAEGLTAEMRQWKFPLHMIDFETTMVALPFYKGMRPYEQVAFQFSHHVIESNDGGATYSIRHAGQYINTEKGFFPNFEFLRELKRQLEQDDGTVFRYATHENSVLCQIIDQLEASDEPDRDVLIAFVKTITRKKMPNRRKGQPEFLWKGERDMVDLCEVVKRYYYDPRMKGSNSIKTVLPAVLNASGFLKAKYGRPIYGGANAEIASQNILSPEPGKVWVKMKDDGSGEVENPYKWLPDVSEYFTEGYLTEPEDEEDLTKVNNGGAALTAYSKIQFSDFGATEALKQALLRYCELDTLAMVFIWEHFNAATITSMRKEVKRSEI